MEIYYDYYDSYDNYQYEMVFNDFDADYDAVDMIAESGIQFKSEGSKIQEFLIWHESFRFSKHDCSSQVVFGSTDICM